MKQQRVACVEQRDIARVLRERVFARAAIEAAPLPSFPSPSLCRCRRQQLWYEGDRRLEWRLRSESVVWCSGMHACCFCIDASFPVGTLVDVLYILQQFRSLRFASSTFRNSVAVTAAAALGVACGSGNTTWSRQNGFAHTEAEQESEDAVTKTKDNTWYPNTTTKHWHFYRGKMNPNSAKSLKLFKCAETPIADEIATYLGVSLNTMHGACINTPTHKRNGCCGCILVQGAYMCSIECFLLL